MLRRLEKRIFIPLPEKSARKSMLQMFLSKQHCPIESGFDFEKTALDTKGYSGADIKLLCKDAAMHALRRILNKLEKLPSSESSNSSTILEMRKQMITASDVESSLVNSNPSLDFNLCSRYSDWTMKFGST